MKIKEGTFSKQLKLGLPNFSNVTVGMSLTVELGEGEDFDMDEIWNRINNELHIEAENGTDQAWMRADELKDSYKLTLKLKKR